MYVLGKQESNYHNKTMPHHLLSLLSFPTTLILFFLSGISPAVLAQNTVAECGPNLLALAPCGPFVQGRAATPVQACCNNLDQLYRQKPGCFCLLLNDTSLASSFPINTTLALQLPHLCSLRIHPSTCPGTTGRALSPPAQVSFGAKPKSEAAGSVSSSPVLPRPRFMGFGFNHNAQVSFKAQVRLLMLLMSASFYITHPIY